MNWNLFIFRRIIKGAPFVVGILIATALVILGIKYAPITLIVVFGLIFLVFLSYVIGTNVEENEENDDN